MLKSSATSPKNMRQFFFRRSVQPTYRLDQKRTTSTFITPKTSKKTYPVFKLEKKDIHLTSTFSSSLLKDVKVGAQAIQKPSNKQLQGLFIASAIPMVGFGFMDNFIMVNAGEYIDSTIGVTFGLATMTAAAIGQVLSNVSGVVFGGTLERSLVNIGLLKPSNLSNIQRQLPICRNVSMLGAALGVILGCGIGASSLIYRDITNEEESVASGKYSILEELISPKGEGTLKANRCNVYLVDNEGVSPAALEYRDPDHFSLKSFHDVHDASNVRKCASSKLILNEARPALNSSSDHRTYSKSMLYVPVVSSEGNVIAVMEYIRENSPSGHGFFSEDDANMAKLIAHHASVVMERL